MTAIFFRFFDDFMRNSNFGIDKVLKSNIDVFVVT